MTTEQIKKWKKDIIKSTREIFKIQGQLHPIAFLLRADRKCMVVGADFHNHEDKDRYLEKIKEICKDNNVIAVLFINEAWGASIKEKDKGGLLNEDGSLKMRVRDMENSKEMIVIVFETKLLSQTSTIEIDRSKGEAVLLEEEMGGITIGGRFHDILTMPIGSN